MTDAFEHVVYNGALMDKKTMAFVQAAEAKLGYKLTILQGCYNPGGVGASAGTHDQGGVIDLAPYDATRKVKVLRDLGAFAWHRLPIPGVWTEHIHFGIRNHGNLAPAAVDQQHYFDMHPRHNGLAGEPLDPNQYPPYWPAHTFKYPPVAAVVPPVENNVTKARDSIVESLHGLNKAVSYLQAVDKDRTVVMDELKKLHAQRNVLHDLLDSLPQK